MNDFFERWTWWIILAASAVWAVLIIYALCNLTQWIAAVLLH